MANKPPGVLTQAVPGVDSLEVRVKRYLAGERRRRRGLPGCDPSPRPPGERRDYIRQRPPHNAQAGAQFENRRVQKVYWACVAGPVSAESRPLGRLSLQGRRRAAGGNCGRRPSQGPARGTSKYRVLKTFDWGTWLEIELETGRTHQIRVQAASRGHPVLGDKQYGSTVTFGPQFDDERLQAIALHARSLTFRDPDTQETVTVEAPVAEYWLRNCEATRFPNRRLAIIAFVSVAMFAAIDEFPPINRSKIKTCHITTRFMHETLLTPEMARRGFTGFRDWRMPS